MQSNTNQADTPNQDDTSNQAKQAVILAAGEGTRLRPLTEDKPKALVEVDGRPLIEHAFDFLLQNAEIQSFIVVTGYKGEQIQQKYEKFYRDTPIVCVHQPEQHGLAHALFQSKLFIDDDFLVMLGDLVFSPDTSLDGFLDASEEGDGALLTERVPEEEASRYGIVDVDQEGRITELVEKPDDPPTNQIITGVYALPQEILPACREIEPSDRGEYELTDALQLLIEEEGCDIRAVPMAEDDWRVDVGYPEDRDTAEERLNNELDFFAEE